MKTKLLNTKPLFQSFDETTSGFLKTISSFDEEEINKIPFVNSWTVAQVAEHVMLSNRGMARSLNEEGRKGIRNIEEGVAGLKSIFLNFEKKLQSPKFILPTSKKYDKEILIAEVEDSFEKLKSLSAKIDVAEIICHPIFGEISKFEILYFVVYHTHRHNHQLENIFHFLKK